MPDEHTPTLQEIAADRDWWLTDSGAHYRELAHWLRGVAAECRLPNPQRELLSLARRYEMRADHLEQKARKSGARRVVVAALVCLLLPSFVAASEHRSHAVMREFQREHPCPSTGRTSGACPGYWKDHVVPLACGGPDTVSNLQWQTIPDARAKDVWERQACAR